jgi:hypothetical protein
MNGGQIFGFSGTSLPIKRYGRKVNVLIELNEGEMIRREEFGTGALVDRDLLEALGSLPQGIAIPWASTNPAIWPFLDSAPGVVKRGSTHVERLYEPAVRVVGVVKRSRSWLQALEAISLFAPHAPRGLILLGEGDPSETLRRAQQIGVGIAHNPKAREIQILTPPSKGYIRSGPADWFFREAVFDEWLARYKESAQAFS